MPFTDADLAAMIAAHPNKASGTIAGGNTVDGIFTRPGRNIQIFDGSVSSTAPEFQILQSVAAANNIDIDTAITINGIAYTVVDTDERNDGLVGLPLTEA